MQQPPRVCAYQYCSTEAPISQSCGRCKAVSYCSREHQAADWKQHKKSCFAPGAKCTRCLLTIKPGSKCQVPHPPHLQEYVGSSVNRSGHESHMHCKACNSQYTVKRKKTSETSEDDYKSPPSFCFEGNHTTKFLPRDVHGSRVFSDSVHLEYHGTKKGCSKIQKKIDKLPRGTRFLVISSTRDNDDDDDDDDEDDDEKWGFSLSRKLPNLEYLVLQQVPCRELVLTEATTPMLLYLDTCQLPEQCQATVQPPLLRYLKLSDAGQADWVYETLRNAKNLFGFDSERLQVEKLFFCSNVLEFIDLHHACCLKELKIYAPVLEKLILQQCNMECHTTRLEKIEILNDYNGLRAECLDECTGIYQDVDSTLVVHTWCSDLSQVAKAYLEGHPRVQIQNDKPYHSIIPAGFMEMLGISSSSNDDA